MWLLYAFLAALLWASVNVFDKFFVSHRLSRPESATVLTGVVGVLFALGILIVRGFEPVPSSVLALIALAGNLYLLAVMAYFRALRHDEVSRVVPIFHLMPFFVLGLAYLFLGERPVLRQVLAIPLLVVGAVMVSTRSLRRIRIGRAFWLILLSAALLSMELVITKYTLGFASSWTVLAYQALSWIPLLAVFATVYIPSLRKDAKRHGSSLLWLLFLSQWLSILGMLFYILSSSLGLVSLVEAVSSTQSFFLLLFALALSHWHPGFLREEIGGGIVTQKMVAVLMMLIGVYLIS